MFKDKSVRKEMSVRNYYDAPSLRVSDRDDLFTGETRTVFDEDLQMEIEVTPMRKPTEVYNDPESEALDQIANLLLEDAEYRKRAGMVLGTKKSNASAVAKHVKALLNARTLKELERAMAKFDDEQTEQVAQYAEIARAKLAG